jgi:hypothetical protein
MKINLAAIGLSTMLLTGGIVHAAVAVQPTIQRVQSPLDRVMTLKIHPGVGANINFEGVGETIETIILENKSFVGLTTNGTLASQEKDKSTPSTASLVHLSLIDKLDIPGVSGINKQTAQSSLTIVTKTRSGSRVTYVFDLRRASKKDVAVALVDFIPQPPPAPTPAQIAEVDPRALERQATIDREQRQALVSKLVVGFGIMSQNGDLKDYTPREFDAIKKMIGDIYGGHSLAESAHKFNVDRALVSKMIVLGGS